MNKSSNLEHFKIFKYAKLLDFLRYLSDIFVIIMLLAIDNNFEAPEFLK